MTSTLQQDSTESPAPQDETPRLDGAFSLDLNFAPNWAKQAPRIEAWQGGGDRPDREDRRERGRGQNKWAREQRGGDRDMNRDMRRDRKDRSRRDGLQEDRFSRKPRGDRKPSRGAEVAPRPESRPVRRAYEPLPPLDVRFVPVQNQLSSVLRQIHVLKRAYPIKDLSLLFLTKPECFAVKIEQGEGAAAVPLFQCKTCHMPTLDKGSIVTHIVKAHLEDYFVKEEQVSDPPAGQFVCVAKCGRTGILLGPPNHHSYAEKVEEIRGTRFPGMSLEEYRRQILTIRDPAAIEQWKEESRRKTVYRPRNAPDPAAAEPVVRKSAAEKYVAEQIAPNLVIESRHASIPSGVAVKVEDRRLARLMGNAWQRESHTPRSIRIALTLAFKRLHLHVFHDDSGKEFVSAVKPVPMDVAHVAPIIRRIADYLREHPKAPQQALHTLEPGQETEIASTLAWLIQKGHIVEWQDGTLSLAPVPRPRKEGKHRQKKTEPETLPPAASPAPVAEQAAASEASAVVASSDS